MYILLFHYNCKKIKNLYSLEPQRCQLRSRSQKRRWLLRTSTFSFANTRIVWITAAAAAAAALILGDCYWLLMMALCRCSIGPWSFYIVLQPVKNRGKGRHNFPGCPRARLQPRSTQNFQQQQEEPCCRGLIDLVMYYVLVIIEKWT